MRRWLIFSASVVMVLVAASFLRAQAPAVPDHRQWNNSPPAKAYYAGKKPSGPAPRRDLSGFWDGTAEGGIMGDGATEYPAVPPEGKKDDGALGEPGHYGLPNENSIKHPPYTPLGEKALEANKTGTGIRAVPPALVNDPVNNCEPQGFPRMELSEFRAIELRQTENHVIFLNQYLNNWRIIWTDGRPLPDINADPRWNGYSVGRWVDDYTFVVDTMGLRDSTWIDTVGRPHSDQLHVEETFHRVDYDTMELSIKIDDPKKYTQPWMALNKYVLHRLPDNFDIEEFLCSPSEEAAYKKIIGSPASDATAKQ